LRSELRNLDHHGVSLGFKNSINWTCSTYWYVDVKLIQIFLVCLTFFLTKCIRLINSRLIRSAYRVTRMGRGGGTEDHIIFAKDQREGYHMEDLGENGGITLK
jgi:hypothetical protein